MESSTNSRFRACYKNLPKDIRKEARKAYRLFRLDPHHPGLRFKCVVASDRIYSARVTLDCRVLGALDEGKIIWFWIGNHREYDALVKRLRLSNPRKPKV